MGRGEVYEKSLGYGVWVSMSNQHTSVPAYSSAK